MIEIKEEQYRELREDGNKFCGRIFSWHREMIIIYYVIDEADVHKSAKQILRELAQGHPITEGKYDVLRHWAFPEVETVNYTVS